MRWRTDTTWIRAGRGVLLAGSPMTLFRFTPAGERLVDSAERGNDVDLATLGDRLLDAGAIHPAPAASGESRAATVEIITPQLDGRAATDGRIVVDDGSVPAIVGATVRLPSNRGPAAARNAGRRLSSSDLIAFVDADVHLDRMSLREFRSEGSWLDALLPHFDDPLVGLVAPRVLGGVHTSLDLGAEPARIRAGTRVSYVPAAAIVVRATAFDDVGGFDETLRFGEDVDFVWRLDAAGWRCRYEPTSTVWHEPRPTLRARLAQQVGYGSSAAPLALRHPRSLAPYRSSVANTVAWTLVALAHPMLGAAVAIASAVTTVRRLPPIPARVGWSLVAHGQVSTGSQLAAAVRRAWWPIAAVLSIGSTRVRCIAVASMLAAPSAATTDVAYGWGLWRGMWQHRTLRPITPQLRSRISASGPDRRARVRTRHANAAPTVGAGR